MPQPHPHPLKKLRSLEEKNHNIFINMFNFKDAKAQNCVSLHACNR